MSTASTSSAKHRSVSVQKYYGGANPRKLRSRSPFGAGRRSGGAFITSVVHQTQPWAGQAAERRVPQCSSAKRREPQCIISPPCQSSCNRRYPYACHAPKGFGRGAPEGKGYATTSENSSLGGVASIIVLGDPRGFPWGAPPTALNKPSG